jgi:type I restriction enzyme S subunit
MSPNPQTLAAEEEAKPVLVPRLRFPEFQLKEGWHDAPIETLLEVRDERQPPTEEAPLYSLTIEDGVTPKSDRYNREFLVRDAANKKYKLVRPDDIVYNPSNLRWGAINFSRLNHEVVVSPIYEVLFVRDRSKLCFEFVAYAVMRDEQIRRFITKAQGTLVERIAVKIEDFIETGLHTPSILAEQQKIAECLSSVDELIAAQARKVDALKTHKKGLMQQLFPREGETQPRLRFPEFQNAGEWQILPLAALADKIMVGIASAATHAYRETGVPMLRNQNIKEGKIDDSSLLYIDPTYEAAHKNKRLRAGDVITVRTGYPGLSAVVPERYNNAQCFTSLITRPKKAVLDANYLCAFVNSEIGKRFILGAEAGGAQKNVNAGSLEALPVYLPGTPEQQRIASCLSSLDALITAETQKHEALKTHKRGLMQQLFPQETGSENLEVRSEK